MLLQQYGAATLSHYQLDFLEEIRNPDGANVVIVDAKAGSGKTYTLCEAAKIIQGSSAFFAFNKDIAAVLKNRGLNAMTMHSLGNKSCNSEGRRFGKPNSYKHYDVNQKLGFDKKRIYVFNQLNSLGRAHLFDPNVPHDKWLELVEHFDVQITKSKSDDPEEGSWEFWADFGRFYAEMFNTTYGINFDDMVSLPIINNWAIPRFDWIMVDEAQDLNPCRLELLSRTMHPGTRAIFVGDPHQAIYGFTGAMCDSMEQIKNRFAPRGVKTLPLSICYRCCKSVIREAQKIVPEIEWAPGAEEGAVNKVKPEDMFKNVQAGEFILCRTIAPMVSACFALIKQGKRAMIKGREIGEDLCNMVDRIASKGVVATPNFLENLNAFRVKETERLTKANRELQIEALEDKCEVLIILSEGTGNIYDLKKKISDIFADDIPENTITCSSVHKAKGLEADTIWILRPDLMPFPKAKKDWQIQQEMNLKYVAITRAKKTLNYVEGK